MKKKDILPEITFKQIPLEFEVEMFFDFLEGGWNRMITEKYPQFLKIKKIKEKKERKLAIKNEIVKIRTELGYLFIGYNYYPEFTGIAKYHSDRLAGQGNNGLCFTESCMSQTPRFLEILCYA